MRQAQAEFDARAGPLCPSQLTAPVLHKVGEGMRAGGCCAPRCLGRGRQVGGRNEGSPCCCSTSRFVTPRPVQVLGYPSVQPLVWGGKGVGSQGDGTAQLLCRGEAEQRQVRGWGSGRAASARAGMDGRVGGE